jgi:radical SAM protein with 4Fe4S-binding SPASM domain
MVWSHYLQKVPVLGEVYKNNYFAWKREYLNLLRRTGIRPGPTVVHWLCTYRCNSNCVYCEASANEVACRELATSEIISVLDDLQAMRVRRFFVTGGEPLVRKDLFDVLDAAKRRGMTVSLITNSLLWEKFREPIRKAGLSSIWTSVDGLEDTHDRNRGVAGAYETTLEAIRFYRKIRIPLREVNTLVHPGNIDELPELQESLRDAGVNRWRLALALPVGRASDNSWALAPDQISALFRYVERTRSDYDVELSEELGYLGCMDTTTRNSPFICPSGLSFCVIMPDGHVLPCQVVYDTRYSEGNVRDEPFRQIWKTGFERFRKVKLEGDCATCVHRKACSGGCWGRIVAEKKCLRGIWDPKTYGQNVAARALAHLDAASE